MWGIIKDLVKDGTTLLLTTQYLEEADQLSDDIAVIDGGRTIAAGTADELKAQIGGHRVVVSLVDAAHAPTAREILGRHGDGEPGVGGDGRTVEVAVTNGPRALQYILSDLGEAGVGLHDSRHAAAEPRRRVPHAHRSPDRGRLGGSPQKETAA